MGFRDAIFLLALFGAVEAMGFYFWPDLITAPNMMAAAGPAGLSLGMLLSLWFWRNDQ